MSRARIEFCGVCAGYRQEAEILQKMLTEQGIEVEAVEAGRGHFYVYLDGKLIFSVKKIKKYPRAKEIFELIKQEINIHPKT